MIILLSREDLNALERERETKSVGCSDFTDAGLTPQLVKRADVIVFYDAATHSMSVLKNRHGRTGLNSTHFLGQMIGEYVRDEGKAAQLLRHANRTPGACAMPRDEHTCNHVSPHDGEHHCKCGETWPAHEGDNALLTHPADTKKKPERVRGFTI